MALSNYIPRYTLADYEQWEGDWELWSGVPVSMSPSADLQHQLLSGEIYLRLRTALEEADCQHCVAVQDVDWRVNEDTILRPDLVIICHHLTAKFIEQTPSLVVEILSDSTRQRDLLYKDRAVGCVVLWPDPKEDGAAQLLQMAVEPDYQGQGVGRIMVEDLACQVVN